MLLLYYNLRNMSSMKNTNWLTVGEYCEKYNVSRSNVYMKVYLDKLPKNTWKKVIKKEMLFLADKELEEIPKIK